MRPLLFVVVLLTLSAAAAAQTDPLQSISLGAGPASGFSGTAAYSELRVDLALSPIVSVRPVLGLTGETGEDVVSPCLIPPCETVRVNRGVWFAPGLGLALNVPEADLPGRLADAHIGVLAQSALQKTRSMELRFGVEVGAAMRVSPRVTVGADLQASRFVRRGFDGDGFFVERTSLVPMARVSYAPLAETSRPTGETGSLALSVASGYATGFGGGAVQSEVRASLPLKAWGLAFEPVVGWTNALSYEGGAHPLCDPAPGGYAACPAYVNPGADAVSVGARLASHSGPSEVLGLALADAHLSLGAHVESPTRETSGYRLSLGAGADVPIARGLALGGEFQASVYPQEAASADRSAVSFAPMLRLVVGR